MASVYRVQNDVQTAVRVERAILGNRVDVLERIGGACHVRIRPVHLTHRLYQVKEDLSKWKSSGIQLAFVMP